ncbi:LicD family protein [Candidatus Saccharibacteria bacterium]|nr:LicD family protein [Candidatus Saccharibacteria bacterium]
MTSTNNPKFINYRDRRLNKDVALRALVDFTQCLEEAGCTWWLSDGTLLGAVREADFISHDYDIDIGVMADTFTPHAINLLIKNGFNVEHILGSREAGLKFIIQRDDTHFDLFLYYARGDTLYCSCYKPLLQYVSARRIDFEYPMFTKMVKYNLLGHQFYVPKNPEHHLEMQYGKDWRTPNPNWHWETDSLNKVETKIIVNPAKDRIIVLKWLLQQQ